MPDHPYRQRESDEGLQVYLVSFTDTAAGNAVRQCYVEARGMRDALGLTEVLIGDVGGGLKRKVTVELMNKRPVFRGVGR